MDEVSFILTVERQKLKGSLMKNIPESFVAARPSFPSFDFGLHTSVLISIASGQGQLCPLVLPEMLVSVDIS